MSALTDYLFAGNRPSTWTVDETIQAVEAMLDWPHRTISDDIMKGVLRTLRCLREDQGGYLEPRAS